MVDVINERRMARTKVTVERSTTSGEQSYSSTILEVALLRISITINGALNFPYSFYVFLQKYNLLLSKEWLL